MKAWLSKCLVVIFTVVAASHAAIVKGVPALQGETPQTKGFLRTTSSTENAFDQNLDFWMTQANSSVPIKHYQVEMTQKLHVVIVSDDFKTFMHVHPQLSPNGHFTIKQRFPVAAFYHIYADGEPNDLNHQVFRFDLAIGTQERASRVLASTGMGVHVGPYEIDLSSVRLHSGQMEMIDVEILKNGKPANDLHPYLGVPAHAVFLNDKDLSYVHVHPMAMGGDMDMSKPIATMPDTASSPPEMMLHVSIKEAGTYKLWLQFRGANNQLYIAEFTMLAS